MELPTEISIRPARCRAGTILPLLPAAQVRTMVEAGFLPATQPSHLMDSPGLFLPVGSILGDCAQSAIPVFQVVGMASIPGLTLPCPLLRALNNWLAADSRQAARQGYLENFYSLPLTRRGYALACITLSDKGFAGKREDLSGPAVADLVKGVLPLCHEQRLLIPDDPMQLRALVQDLAVIQGYDIIVTSGGTGLSPRDQTPEALLPVLTRRLPGFEQRMMHSSLKITPHAALSRALAGTIDQCLLIALPGSVKAATENLNAIAPALPHALEKLKGDPSDCGG